MRVELHSARIDCGSYGVQVELDRPRRLKLGARRTRDTILIDPLDGAQSRDTKEIARRYRLVPFVE